MVMEDRKATVTPRQVTFGTPCCVVCPDGQVDVHFSWTPPAPLPQTPIAAVIHMPFPVPDPGPPAISIVQAFAIAVATYIRIHEAGLAPAAAAVPATILAFNGTTQTIQV